MSKTIELSAESRALLLKAAKNECSTLNVVLEETIYDSYMPVAKPLLVEAEYLWAGPNEGAITPWVVKQSISRGIQWLSDHPILDSAILEHIFSYFSFRMAEECKNEFVTEKMREVTALLEARVPDYAPSAPLYYDVIVKDMLTQWKHIWREHVVYDVLSAIVFSQKPERDFDWCDGVMILHDIDRAAWEECVNA